MRLKNIGLRDDLTKMRQSEKKLTKEKDEAVKANLEEIEKAKKNYFDYNENERKLESATALIE